MQCAHVLLKYFSVLVVRDLNWNNWVFFSKSCSSQGIFVFSGLNLCEYKGCVVSEEAVTTGLMEKICNLEVQDEDVFVASFPKSGTTWLQQVVYLLYHPDNPDSELMEWKFPYLEHAYPGERKTNHCNFTNFF